MRIVEILREIDRALLIGIGGGGDIVSTLAVGEFFKLFDVECVYGGVVWERISRDPKPGPRAVEEIENCRRINDCLAWINRDCHVDGLKLIVAQVAEYLGKEVVGVDITKGAYGIQKSLEDFIESEGIDLIVGVDAGGDSLARGNERNLCSPLADSIMLSALAKLPSILAVVGFGSDGELTRDEIERYLSEVAEKGGLLGVSVIMKDYAEELFKFVKEVATEASRIPILSARGYKGRYTIWGHYEIDVSILNALIFYIDTRVVYGLSPLPRAVEGSKSILEANEMLHEIGIRTELDVELSLASAENHRS
jgi:hypothetical protein